MSSTLSYHVIECESGVRAFVRATPIVPVGPLCTRCGHPPCEMCPNGWCDVTGPVVEAEDGVPIVRDDDVSDEHEHDSDGGGDDSTDDVDPFPDTEMCCDGECVHAPELLDAFYAWALGVPTCPRCDHDMSFFTLGACSNMICDCAAPKSKACACRFDLAEIDAWIAAFPPAIAEHNLAQRALRAKADAAVVAPTTGDRTSDGVKLEGSLAF